MSNYLSEKTIELAKEAWVHRNSLIIADGDRKEADRLLEFHDTLLALAQNFDEAHAPKKATRKRASKKSPFAKTIKTKMDELGYTVDDLSTQSGVQKQTLDAILSGETQRPQARTLDKIMQALGLEEETLERA